ncbi:MAG TPA: hypothetical protein VF157_10860 [Chloroflexota bacterium]
MEPVDYGETVVVRPVGEPAGSVRTYVERRPASRLAAAGWPVHWSALWAGVLISLTAAMILGLAASAIGFADAAAHTTTWAAFSRAALIYGVVSGLVAFFLGGFMSVKMAGIAELESGLLHGALTWLLALPILLALGALGAGHFFGNFSIALVAPPVWLPPPSPATGSVDPAAAAAVRDVAVSALFAVMMGLLGGLIGGWMATEEFRAPAGRAPWDRRPV